jgi:uncharacterized small protein (DUF1192 family)
MFADEPRPKRGLRVEPAKFDGCDVEELRDYIAALREEIARVELAITAREAVRGAAESFFRKPS